MSWWGWLILGGLLMGAELLAVDAAFYLVFLGAAAVGVGLLGLVGLTLPLWAQWVLFALLAVGGMVFFRRRLYGRLHGSAPEVRDGVEGASVGVTENVPAGGYTRVRLRGSQWAAVNVGRSALLAGQRARVEGVDGVTLRIVSPSGQSAGAATPRQAKNAGAATPRQGS